jgi:surface antigen
MQYSLLKVSMMRKHVLAVLLVALISLVVLNPAPASARCGGNGGQVAGAVIGGLFGGVVGRNIAGKRNKTLGALLGGGFGALIGSSIGKSLDACEKEKMASATESALNSDEAGPETTQTWTSTTRENVKGTVAASPPQAQPDGRICRNVIQVNYVDGREMKDSPRFCRTPPSAAWTPG